MAEEFDFDTLDITEEEAKTKIDAALCAIGITINSADDLSVFKSVLISPVFRNQLGVDAFNDLPGTTLINYSLDDQFEKVLLYLALKDANLANSSSATTLDPIFGPNNFLTSANGGESSNKFDPLASSFDTHDRYMLVPPTGANAGSVANKRFRMEIQRCSTREAFNDLGPRSILPPVVRNAFIATAEESCGGVYPKGHPSFNSSWSPKWTKEKWANLKPAMDSMFKISIEKSEFRG
jgi:hypothetical protein